VIRKRIPWILLLCVMNSALFAEDVSLTGVIYVKPPIKRVTHDFSFSSSPPRQLALLKIDLSTKAQQAVAQRIARVQTDTPIISSAREVQLAMNGVPVLNQGSHGTCVTFAATAAIDAILGKGDYISQLCQLELGQHLEKNAYTSSGWNGSWGRIILSQMDVFGMVPKSYQRSKGCGGLTEYPLAGAEPVVEQSLFDFHQMSEPMPQHQVAWSSILEAYQVSSDNINEENILLDVKNALTHGDRVTFGVLLLDFNQGNVGAVGTYHERFDSWILTPEIANDINDRTEFAGHEMIITGFNDDAIATDAQGRKYQGLLTLRNSWGSDVGDKGNFYMSYDYFKALILEAQRIRHLI